MHLVVIIPAYNESQVIAQVLAAIPKQISGISRITPLVIDDNSTDATKEIAQTCGALCIRHEANLGAGGATITGLEAAKRLKADIVVTLDGDNQHDPREMVHLIAPLLQKKTDVVIGSRLLNASKAMPFHKKIGNNLLNVVTFAFFRIWVTDSQSGYKAFSRRALHRIHLSTNGYEFCSEIIGQIREKRLRFQEIPITTIYTDYSKAKGQLALNAINIVLGLMIRYIR